MQEERPYIIILSYILYYNDLCVTYTTCTLTDTES